MSQPSSRARTIIGCAGLTVIIDCLRWYVNTMSPRTPVLFIAVGGQLSVVCMSYLWLRYATVLRHDDGPSWSPYADRSTMFWYVSLGLFSGMTEVAGRAVATWSGDVLLVFGTMACCASAPVVVGISCYFVRSCYPVDATMAFAPALASVYAALLGLPLAAFGAAWRAHAAGIAFAIGYAGKCVAAHRLLADSDHSRNYALSPIRLCMNACAVTTLPLLLSAVYLEAAELVIYADNGEQSGTIGGLVGCYAIETLLAAGSVFTYQLAAHFPVTFPAMMVPVSICAFIVFSVTRTALSYAQPVLALGAAVGSAGVSFVLAVRSSRQVTVSHHALDVNWH